MDRDYKRPRYDDRRDGAPRDRRDYYRDEERRGGDRDRDRDRERDRERGGRDYDRRDSERHRERGDRPRERPREASDGGANARALQAQGASSAQGGAPGGSGAAEAELLEAKKRREEEEYRQRVERQAEMMEEDDEARENRLIEERRARRAALLEKHKAAAAAAGPSSAAEPAIGAPAAGQPPAEEKATAKVEAAPTAENGLAAAKGAAAAGPTSAPSGPAAAPPAGEEPPRSAASDKAAGSDSESDEPTAKPQGSVPGAAVSDEARARESELKAFMLARLKSTEKGSKPREPPPKKADQAEADDPDGGGGGFDMFNDDVEDVDREAELDEAAAMDRGDNYDDKEGYYAHRVGDVLAERYKVLGSFGKGVFSTVVRCAVLGAAEGEPAEVAVKVQRNNEMMRRAGEKEIAILERLRNADPENRKHCIRLVGRFDHEDHLCMVFEALHQNLRSAVKQFGHKRGIQIDAVRAYSRQLFTALRHMEKLGIVHADLKPDNIVVNEKYNLLKVCDFGSAVEADDQELTPYMVSRFYRAPEIMMGLHFSCPIDAWAAAVSLFELYTGRIMFMGNSNNSMLKLIQEVKGKMPHKLIRKGIFAELHFDPDYDFLYKERDRVTGREVIRLIKFEQRAIPGHDLRSLLSQGTKLSEAEARKVVMLADFLDKALTLDPAKRLKPAEALKHPFCDLNRK